MSQLKIGFPPVLALFYGNFPFLHFCRFGTNSAFSALCLLVLASIADKFQRCVLSKTVLRIYSTWILHEAAVKVDLFTKMLQQGQIHQRELFKYWNTFNDTQSQSQTKLAKIFFFNWICSLSLNHSWDMFHVNYMHSSDSLESNCIQLIPVFSLLRLWPCT